MVNGGPAPTPCRLPHIVGRVALLHVRLENNTRRKCNQHLNEGPPSTSSPRMLLLPPTGPRRNSSRSRRVHLLDPQTSPLSLSLYFSLSSTRGHVKLNIEQSATTNNGNMATARSTASRGRFGRTRPD